MKKNVFLLFFVALTLNVYSATIYVNVYNVSGNTVSNAYVKLYDNSWNLIKTGYTNSSGMATFALLDYGTYNYEVYYTGESQEFWGSDEGFYLGSPTLTRNFTRYWPYKYSESLPSSSVIVNQQVTFSFIVKNKVSTSRSVQVELWVDRNQASSYDFHESSSFQTISSNGTKTYTFNFTPTSTGTYYWKMRVYSYLDNGSLWVTDSYNWQTAFTANYQTGDLDVYVKNVNGNYIENAYVKLYDDSWDLVETDYTNSSGRADFNDVRYGTYNYEVLYTGDAQEFWGNKENIVINSSSESSTFTRNWPFRNNYSISASNIYVGQQETINVEVKNNLSFSRNVKVELWLDRDKVSSWDYNQTSDYQSIGSGGTKTYTFNYTPSNAGTYYWKMHVLSYNDGAGGYIVTDSYSWTTAFVATQQTGDLNIYVKNVNDSYVENATVVIYNSTWETKIDSLQTDNTGKVTFNDLNYGSYNFEVYYLSTVREYWGYDDFDINSSTATITFVRDWPYIKNFSISEESPDVGEEVDFDIIIKNDLSFSRDVKVELWIDRNKEAPFDIHAISDIKTVNNILNKNFDFDVYPPSPGDYYWRAVVYSYNDASEAFIPTDTYPWSDAFNVDGTSSPIDLKGRIAYQVYSGYLADPIPGDTVDGNIFIYDFEKGNSFNLTYNLDVKNAMNPHYNNAGSMLTFMAIPKSKETQYGNLEIYLYDLSTETLTRLTDNNMADEDSKFSPDGHRIVFKRSSQIFEYNLLDNSVTQLTFEGNEKSGPVYSPELGDNRIVFWETISEPSKIESICLREEDGTIIKLISGDENNRYYYPIWKDNNTILLSNSAPILGDDIYFYSISSSTKTKANFNSLTDDSDGFPINSEYIGFSSRRLNNQQSGYDLFISDTEGLNVVNIVNTNTSLHELGGTYSPFSSSNSLVIQNPKDDDLLYTGNQLLLKVEAFSNGSTWQGVGITVKFIGQQTYEYTGLKDDGTLGDEISNDGTYSKIINLPDESGKYSIVAQATYTDNDIQNNISSDSINIVINQPSPEISISPSSLNFGTVEIGSSKEMNFTIENIGSADLNGEVSLEPPFSLSSGSPYNLSPGQSQQVKIKFTPEEVKEYINNIIFSGDGNKTRILQGKGTSSIIAPVIAKINDHSIYENEHYTGPEPTLISGTLPLSWELISAPINLVINTQTGQVSWDTPVYNSNPYIIKIKGSNSSGSDSVSYNLSVLKDVSPITYNISGRITVQDPFDMSDVKMQIFNEDFSDTVLPDTNGDYIFENIDSGNYVIRPLLEDVPYPDSVFINGLSANLFNIDFIIYSNPAPIIYDQTFEIDEQEPVGTFIGNIVATDEDSISFSLISGNINNCIKLEPTGGLFVNDSVLLDYELYQSIELVVEVQDYGIGNKTSQAIITVLLNNINEIGKPVLFSPPDKDTITVPFILSWECTDPDDGDILTYNLNVRIKGTNEWEENEMDTATTLDVTEIDNDDYNTYEWKVIASDGKIQNESDIWEFTIIDDNCQTPSGLTESSITSDSADLNWDSVSGVSCGYEVRFKNSGSNWTNLTILTNDTIISELDCNTQYEWQVRSNCCNSFYSEWSSSRYFTTSECPCVIPAQPGTINGETNPYIDSAYNYEILSVSEAETYNWNATGGTITGDSNIVSVTWTSLGGQTLSVEAVNNCGASDETILDVTVLNSVTSIANATGNSIKIYPNPFKDEIFIGLDNSDDILNIEVYNTLGVKIKEVKNLHLSRTIVNMTEIKEGIYSLIIYTTNGRVIRSAVKF